MKTRLSVLFLTMAVMFLSTSCDETSHGTPISDEEAEEAAQDAAIDGLAIRGFWDTTGTFSEDAYYETISLKDKLLALAAATDEDAHAHLVTPRSPPPSCHGTEDESDETRVNFDCEDHIEGHISKDGDVYDVELTLIDGGNIFTIDSDGDGLTITEDSISGTVEILLGDGDPEVVLAEATFDNVRRDNDECEEDFTGGTLKVDGLVEAVNKHVLAVFGPGCDFIQLFDQGSHSH